MNLHSAQYLARTLMKEHGLTGWVFAYSKSLNTLGTCHWDTKTLKLSLSWTFKGDDARVRNTILHEISHALCGAGHGHDAVWRARAISIGCTGERCSTITHDRPEKRYLAVCATHGTVAQFSKKLRVQRSCPKCHSKFDTRYLVRLTPNPKFFEQFSQIAAERPR